MPSPLCFEWILSGGRLLFRSIPATPYPRPGYWRALSNFLIRTVSPLAIDKQPVTASVRTGRIGKWGTDRNSEERSPRDVP